MILESSFWGMCFVGSVCHNIDMRETEETVYGVYCEECEFWLVQVPSKRMAERERDAHTMDYMTYGHTTSVEKIEE